MSHRREHHHDVSPVRLQLDGFHTDSISRPKQYSGVNLPASAGGYSTEASSPASRAVSDASPRHLGYSVDAADLHPVTDGDISSETPHASNAGDSTDDSHNRTPALRTGRIESTLRPSPSADSVAALVESSTHRANLWESIRVLSITAAFSRVGIDLPIPAPSAREGACELNKPLQAAMSLYIRRVRPSLQEFVELIRCQTTDDYRPNKALLPSTLRHTCRGYPKLDALIQIASEGPRIHLQQPLPAQAQFPRNHPSASERINVLRKNIRKEQDSWRCIVVDTDIIEVWPEIFVSPFGVVDKGDGDPRTTGRVIHDLSFPEGSSVNDLTDRTDIADPTFKHCSRDHEM